MFSRLKNFLIFGLEQFVMHGAATRFGLVLVLLLLLALTAGFLIRQLVPDFESYGDAVWWAFEHVMVPEYVDGDEGIIKRSLATVLIVLGSILFAGAVIAILVQWLDETMARLEQGLTPVALNAHIVLLGWTSRIPTILEEIMVSQRQVEGFLRQRGVARTAPCADSWLESQGTSHADRVRGKSKGKIYHRHRVAGISSQTQKTY